MYATITMPFDQTISAVQALPDRLGTNAQPISNSHIDALSDFLNAWARVASGLETHPIHSRLTDLEQEVRRILRAASFSGDLEELTSEFEGLCRMSTAVVNDLERSRRDAYDSIPAVDSTSDTLYVHASRTFKTRDLASFLSWAIERHASGLAPSVDWHTLADEVCRSIGLQGGTARLARFAACNAYHTDSIRDGWLKRELEETRSRIRQFEETEKRGESSPRLVDRLLDHLKAFNDGKAFKQLLDDAGAHRRADAMPDDLISQEEAADIAGVSPKTISRRMDDGSLSAYLVNGQRKASRREVELMVEAGEHRKRRVKTTRSGRQKATQRKSTG